MNRDAIIFCRTVVPAHQAPDREWPTQVVVTKEASGYAVWVSDYGGDDLRRFFYQWEDGMCDREGALCMAVFLSAELREQHEEALARAAA